MTKHLSLPCSDCPFAEFEPFELSLAYPAFLRLLRDNRAVSERLQHNPDAKLWHRRAFCVCKMILTTRRGWKRLLKLVRRGLNQLESPKSILKRPKSVAYTQRASSYSYVSWLYRSHINTLLNSDGEESRQPVPKMLERFPERIL